jgi:hypothetical protein
MRHFVPFFAFLSLLTVPAAAAPSWQAELLQLHNSERARWRSEPVVWDPGLAASADLYARELARTDRWQHSPAALRRGQGENLWMGTTGGYSIRGMLGGWLGERRWFQPGIFPAVSRTGQWSDVAHYTQIVASRTDRVGCAIQANRRWTYLVCRYGPSGNVDGRPMP